MKRILLATSCLLPLVVHAQTPFSYTGRAGSPAVAGDPLKLNEAIANGRTKQDVNGDISGQHRRTADGTVFRPLASLAVDTKNPRDFGAICDGYSHPLSSVAQVATVVGGTVSAGWTLAQWQANGWPHATDLGEEMDAAGYQEAAYAISPTIGGTLEVPAGCMANRTIHIVRALTTVDGHGAGNIRTYPTHNFNLFSNDAPLNTYQNFAINPDGGVLPPSGSTEVFGIYDPYVDLPTPLYGNTANYKMTVNHVTGTNLWSGVLSGGGDDLINFVHLSFFTGPPGSTGVRWDNAGYADGRQLWNSGIYGATYGTAGTGSSGLIDIENTELAGNGRCFLFQPTANHTIGIITFGHSWCDSNTIGGGYLDARAANTFIARFRAVDSWFGGSTGSGVELYGNVWGAFFGGGTQFFGNAGDGATVDASVGNAKGLTFDAILAAGNGGAAVSIGAGVTHWAVLNSVLGPQSDFGPNAFPIYVVAGASDYYRILGNDMTGNTNAISNSATGTHTAVANNLQ